MDSSGALGVARILHTAQNLAAIRVGDAALLTETYKDDKLRIKRSPIWFRLR
jgi:hypothetical protein